MKKKLIQQNYLKFLKKVLCFILMGMFWIEMSVPVSASGAETFKMVEVRGDATDDPEYRRAMGEIDAGFYDNSAYARAMATSSYVHNSRFSGYTIKNGIDVSKYQGKIDWDKVKADGVEFAIIRVGYRGYSSGELVEDEYFVSNINGAKAAGIKVGVYIFSQAITDAEAVEEANYVLNRISGYDIDLPVVIDYEYVSEGTGRLYNAFLSVDAATSICKTFCKTVEAAGYTGMVYANKSMLQNQLNAGSISSEYKVWLANYTTETSYEGAYDFWQYTSSGSIDGINGNVDCNFWYINEPAIGTQTIPNGVYTISSALNNNMVLDIAGGSTADCANVQLYQSNDTLRQKFEVTYIGEGYYTISSLLSDKMLDVANAASQDGTNVQQCSGNGSVAQKWSIQDAGNNYYKIVSAIGNKYLDVANGNASNGANVQIWSGNGSLSQLFRFTPYNERPVEDGIYVVGTKLNAAFALDVQSAAFTDGTNVQLYSKNGSRAQNFLFQYLGNGFYKISCVGTGKVLEVDGSNVRQNTYAGTKNQKWRIELASGGGYKIISANGKCMDVAGGRVGNGNNIQVWSENNTVSQVFTLSKYDKQVLADGTYTILTSLDTGKALDIAGGSKENYAKVQIYDSNNTTAQKFTVKYLGNGYYSIKAVHSGMALDVNGGSNANGTKVQQYASNGTDSQKWIIQTDGDGKYYICSAISAGALDVSYGKAVNGTNIQIWTPNGSASQKFVFKK